MATEIKREDLPTADRREAEASDLRKESDVTGIYDESLQLMFPLAVAMKVDITRTSKVMRHPLENGGNVADHRIIEPLGASLLMFLPGDKFKAIYAQLETAYLKAQIFTIQTKVSSYPNMVIAELPHEETPDFDDLVQVIVKLEEVQFGTTQFEAIAPAPTRTASKSTTTRGEQSPKEAPAKKGSLAYDGYKKIFGKK